MAQQPADRIASDLRAIVGPEHVRSDDVIAQTYARRRARQAATLPTSSFFPPTPKRSRAIARLCNAERVPLVVRGAGTGFTGGAVPTAAACSCRWSGLNRILEIDELNLLAVVEPNVDQRATCSARSSRSASSIRRIPPASNLSSIGGNVAECAGGPRAFK